VSGYINKTMRICLTNAKGAHWGMVETISCMLKMWNYSHITKMGNEKEEPLFKYIQHQSNAILIVVQELEKTIRMIVFHSRGGTLSFNWDLVGIPDFRNQLEQWDIMYAD